MLRRILTKGHFMITTVVGNAHAFLVLHDYETKRDYGVHIEISNPRLFVDSYANQSFPPVTLEGDFVMQELADLDFCKSGSKGRLFDESV